MATDRQIAANRANASKSTGPKTPAGRQNSSRNSIRHGLLAQSIVLKGESAKRFHALLSSLRHDFQPCNSVEANLVETMAVNRWRQMRLWALERARLDLKACKPQTESASLDAHGPDAATRCALAFESLSDNSRTFELMNRYESCYDRQYSRALNNLIRLREKSDFSKRTQSSNDETTL